MSAGPVVEPAHLGHLAENVMHFARVLRAAGMPVGTDRVQLALRALQLGGLEHREDFRATLATCFIDRAGQRELFDQAFHIFWRDPDLLGRAMAMLLPQVQAKEGAVPPVPENRRLADAMFGGAKPRSDAPEPPEQIDIDATLTFSAREALRQADFETMSSDEWREAQRMLRDLQPLFERLPTRRPRPAQRPGTVDLRATMRDMARHDGELWNLRYRKPATRTAPLVVLADISGSMSRYSRMLLHFTHTLARAGQRVESFVFGTRLTRTTRALRHRDPDIAVTQVMRDVRDWSGGTRITACLHDFNLHWARRVMPSNATVLLITDGLEHGDTQALSFEMARLHKSCRRLLWLNPLLRFAGFEPRAAGIRAMLPHVDRLIAAHNIDSLAQLAALLSGREAASATT